jgi:hypothetical protein
MNLMYGDLSQQNVCRRQRMMSKTDFSLSFKVTIFNGFKVSKQPARFAFITLKFNSNNNVQYISM